MIPAPISPDDPTANGTVNCQAGHRVTGGGFSQPTGYDVIITDPSPTGPGSWRVYGRNTGTTAETVDIWAICMNTTPSIVIAKAPGFKTASPKKHK